MEDEYENHVSWLGEDMQEDPNVFSNIRKKPTESPDSPTDNSWVLVVVVLVGAVLIAVIGWIINRFYCHGGLPPIRRQYTRYDYTALEDDSNNAEKLEMEKKQPQKTVRGNALLICQYYLRTSGRYTYLEQLNDIGSRIDKYWFTVHDTVLKTERLMTMVPHNEYFPITLNCSTKKILTELFLALQHPYIYPILDIDFKAMSDETFVVTIFPFNKHGSLKDLIYRSNCKEEWQEKYSHRSVGLPEPQIQRIGRQLLEALTFLQERGFPHFANLHSGNVIMQNGVARLTGLENTILGYTSRICPLLKKKLKDSKEAIDTLCFGHVLFEMAAAYELNVAHPSEKHLQDIQDYAKVLQVLSFIFDGEDGKYPTIEEICMLHFFRSLDLREMRGATSSPKLSQCVKNLLREVKHHQKYPKSNKRSHSTSSLEMPLSSNSPSSLDIIAIDSQCSGTVMSDLHRNISSSSSVNCLAVWENGDVRRHLSVTSAHDFAQRRSCDSTPYSSMLDVSLGGHFNNNNNGGGEEYHTPPTTPTTRSQLDVREDSEDGYNKTNRLNNPHTPNLLEHCFKKIHNSIN
ncbi:hypothetical protein CHUAL_011241 [Chamberlinius hualienensis]